MFLINTEVIKENILEHNVQKITIPYLAQRKLNPIFYSWPFSEGITMQKTIGRTDKADFPELNLEGVAVKIDTGAYTSSIHCDDIHEEGGLLKCSFLDEEHPNYNHKSFTFDTYKIARVKSSNGLVQKRYAIQSSIKIMGKTYKISLTLSDRKEMRFPVLLGRKFLSKKFIVDPHLTNVSFNATKP